MTLIYSPILTHFRKNRDEVARSMNTKDILPDLPGKEPIRDFDFPAYLERFDPSTLTKRELNEFARRNPHETAYEIETPEPLEDRLSILNLIYEHNYEDFVAITEKYRAAPDVEKYYKKARTLLIRMLGLKAARYIVQQQYDCTTPEERKLEKDLFEQRVKILMEEQENARDEWDDYEEYDPDNYMMPVEDRSEKVYIVRKGLLKKNKKPLTQREFAKYIEYPINKYTAAEKEDASVTEDLLEKLVMRCSANPYWLFDDTCPGWYGRYEDNGDEPTVFASPEVILKWILEGKPHLTRWQDGMTDW